MGFVLPHSTSVHVTLTAKQEAVASLGFVLHLGALSVSETTNVRMANSARTSAVFSRKSLGTYREQYPDPGTFVLKRPDLYIPTKSMDEASDDREP